MSSAGILRRKTVRDLRRRRPQIAAVAATVAIGILLFSANLDAARNLAASYREHYDRVDFADVWITGGPIGELAPRLATDERVTGLEVRTLADVPVRIGEHELLGRIVGQPTDHRPEVNRLLIEKGRDLSEADTDAVVLEQHAAAEFDLEPGDRLELLAAGRWRSVEIVGVGSSAEYLFPARSRREVFTVPDEFAVVFGPESLAAEIAPDGPVQVVLTVQGGDPAVADELVGGARRAGATEAYTRAEQPSNWGLQSDVQGFEQLSFLFPVLFLSVAGMAVYVLLGRLVRLERTQIGMLVANGVTPGAVARHYVDHALVAAMLGAVPGLVGGLVLGRWISGVYTDFLDIPITVTDLRVNTIAWSIGFTVLVAAVSGAVPARAAARTEPAEAMRPPAPVGVGRPSLVERLLPWRLPTGARVVARDMSRNRRRVATTGIGVVLALVVIVTSLALDDTFTGLVDRQFTEVDRRDLSLVLDHPVSDADLDELAALEAVATAERSTEMPVVITDGRHRSEQLLQVFESGTAAHGFVEPLPAEGLLLSSTARHVLDVATGEVVDVLVPGLGVTITAPVAGFVDEPVPSVSYASMATWESAGGPAPRSVVLTLVDDRAHRRVRDQLASRDEVVAVTDHRSTADLVESLVGVTIVLVGVMIVFGMVMALALLFNTVTVSISERTGEIATMQANGVPRAWIRRTVAGEILAIVALAIAPGVLAGRVVAALFIRRFDSDSFTYDLRLSGTSLMAAAAMIIVGSLVAQLPALRRIDRIDLAAVVRERSI
ncbi:MAG: ABC transporter permease [Acidimicrobiales bacterium]